MPAALKRLCAGGCGELVDKGKCKSCGGKEQRERVADRRLLADGVDLYNTARWQELRVRFRRRLAEVGILAACGARLPGAPVTQDSTCEPEAMDDGEHKRLTGRTLSVDHIDEHQGDRGKFFDIMNLQLLCDRDHAAKTHREERQ